MFRLRNLLSFVVAGWPFLLSLWAWGRLYKSRRAEPARFSSVAALAIVTALSAFAAGTDLYFAFRPSYLPPWQSPEVLLKGSLFLLAPIGMVSGFVAWLRSAPSWLCWIVEILSIYLCLFGLAVGSSF
jgi:hypothetical protein